MSHAQVIENIRISVRARRSSRFLFYLIESVSW